MLILAASVVQDREARRRSNIALLIAGFSLLVAVAGLLVAITQSRKGGPTVDWRVAWLWRLRRGRAVSLRFYRDRAKALEAAGLKE